LVFGEKFGKTHFHGKISSEHLEFVSAKVKPVWISPLMNRRYQYHLLPLLMTQIYWAMTTKMRKPQINLLHKQNMDSHPKTNYCMPQETSWSLRSVPAVTYD
jgi:hypothetical protein